MVSFDTSIDFIEASLNSFHLSTLVQDVSIADLNTRLTSTDLSLSNEREHLIQTDASLAQHIIDLSSVLFSGEVVLGAHGEHVGVGTTPTTELDVSGSLLVSDDSSFNANVYIQGDLTIDGAIYGADMDYNAFEVTDSGHRYVDDDGFVLHIEDASNSIQLLSATNMSVDGNIESTGNMDITGDASYGGNLYVNGNVIIDGSFEIPGVDIYSLDISIADPFDVDFDSDGFMMIVEKDPQLVSSTILTSSDMSINGTLDVGGTITADDIVINSLPTSGGTNGVNYNPTTGTFSYTTSTRRHKQNIKTLAYNENFINTIRAVEFEYKPEYGGKKHLGFIAEEVQAVDPLMAVLDDDKQAIDIDTRAIIAHLVKEVQQLRRELNELKSK